MSDRIKRAIFCILPVVLLYISVNLNPTSADEVDDLLNKCAIAPNPKPSVMVYDYELNPETLMPGDVAVLTITLRNMQEEPIEKDVDIKDEIVHNYTIKEGNYTTGGKENPKIWEEKLIERTIDIDTETYYTMDAYIKDAYIVENEFKVYNRYLSAGVIGPDEKVDFAFKIKAPHEEGIYMLKFIADIEDTQGQSSKGIRYFIPVTVSGTVSILPLEVSQNEVRLEVINEGLSDVVSVYVVVSNANGLEVQPKKVYIGKIKPVESAIAVFNINKAENGEESAVLNFKAVYWNGVNRHESNPVCVRIPCSAEEEKDKEKGESLLEEHSETALTATTTPIPSSSNLSLTPAVFAFAALLVPGILYLFLSKRKSGGKGEVGGEK